MILRRGRKVKFELLGKVSWSGVNVIIASVHEMERAREGVAIVLNYVWHSAIVKSG